MNKLRRIYRWVVHCEFDNPSDGIVWIYVVGGGMTLVIVTIVLMVMGLK